LQEVSVADEPAPTMCQLEQEIEIGKTALSLQSSFEEEHFSTH
jgi:hypothetical protein